MNDCIIARGTPNVSGYIIKMIKGVSKRVQVHVYEKHHNITLDKAYTVYQYCKNKRCINIDHLYSISVSRINKNSHVPNTTTIDERINDRLPDNDNENDCMIWQGVFSDMYSKPILNWNGKVISVNKYLFEKHIEKLKINYFVYNTCGNKKCCNLKHFTQVNRIPR